MRKIRLTERQFHSLIRESVNRILSEVKYTSGRVSNDGNGMVGGSYGSASEIYATATIDIDNVAGMVVTLDEDMRERFVDYFCDKNEDGEEITIVGYLSGGYDESTNDSWCDLDDVEEPTEAYDIINSCGFISDELKEQLIIALKNEVNSLDVDDFEVDESQFDEPDYPDEY